jgi:hypothetical protein
MPVKRLEAAIADLPRDLHDDASLADAVRSGGGAFVIAVLKRTRRTEIRSIEKWWRQTEHMALLARRIAATDGELRWDALGSLRQQRLDSYKLERERRGGRIDLLDRSLENLADVVRLHVQA